MLEAEFSKTWEFKSHNVAVYSIQGRRDHMEDRFEVLTDLANKTHPSIFGIFDGHGGEVGVLWVYVCVNNRASRAWRVRIGVRGAW